MVSVVNPQPHPSVVKEAICRHCGVTLSYVPAEVKNSKTYSYDGSSENIYHIECPSCHHEVNV